jgi:protein-arginine kinase activator protein McsA
LYVTEDVLTSCGIYTDETGTVVNEEKKKKKKKKDSVVSIEDLRRMMDDAIQNEDYEVAAEIRDKITKMEEEK